MSEQKDEEELLECYRREANFVVANFLSLVIFVWILLFLGMVMYANEVETKEKSKLLEIKN